MLRLALLAIGALLCSCTQSSAGRAEPRASTEDIDTAMVRRVCVAEADSVTVEPDSLLALARSGCLMRDQRRPSRVP